MLEIPLYISFLLELLTSICNPSSPMLSPWCTMRKNWHLGGLFYLMNTITAMVAKELQLTEAQVIAVLELFEQGCTIPFIARYRKEATGSLDETVVTAIRDRNEKIQDLIKRKTAILESLTERELLTDELKAAIENAQTMTALEDAYLPYRPKRKTRASAAVEKGLKPLAERLLAQLDGFDPEKEAAFFLSEEKGVHSVEEALA